jgi:hypothetical protein
LGEPQQNHHKESKMSEETIKIRKSVKVDPEEAKKLDPAKIGLMLAGPGPEAEVEGQYACWTKCDWCGHWGRSQCTDYACVTYRCGWCGGVFTVC